MAQALPVNNPLEQLSAMSQAVWQKTQLSAVSQAVWQKTMEVMQVLDKGRAVALAASASGSALGSLSVAAQKAQVCAPPHDAKIDALSVVGDAAGAGAGNAVPMAGRAGKSSKPRPTWVKEPSQNALAIAQEVAGNAQVCWSGFIRPVDKVWEISSGFGPRWGRHHNGVDLAAPTGEPVLAADAGEVTFAGWEPSGYGYLVEITHSDGWKTLYAHNSEIFTWEGQQVKRGDCISCVGETGRATGPHLHWEIRNQHGCPVDPSCYVAL